MPWKSKERQAYYNAMHRCANPRAKAWKNYGGRGIEFRFLSFEQFMECIGPRPKRTCLDRINNDGHYEPGNVRWTTPSQSVRNERKRHSKSGFTGVRKSYCKWQAHIKVNGRRYFLGNYETPEEAHSAYLNATKTLDFVPVASQRNL